MKKQIRRIGILCGVAFSALVLAGGVIASSGTTAPQDVILIDGKKPASFSHPVHLNLGLDCASCHHDKQHEPLSAEAISALDDTSVLKCVSCHNSELPNKELQRAKDLFHAKCKTCHKEGFAGKKGPTKCTGCHLKKKKAYEGC